MFYKLRSPKVGHVALLRPSIAPKPDPVSPSLITNELTHLLPAWLFVSVAADDSIPVSQTCSARRKDLFAALKHRLFSTFFVDYIIQTMFCIKNSGGKCRRKCGQTQWVGCVSSMLYYARAGGGHPKGSSFD